MPLPDTVTADERFNSPITSNDLHSLKMRVTLLAFEKFIAGASFNDSQPVNIKETSVQAGAMIGGRSTNE